MKDNNAVTSKKITVEIISTLLIMLFLYAAFSKWLDMRTFVSAMHNQPFPSWMATVFVWTVPTIEVIISIMLMVRTTQLAGLVASLILMTIFSIYIASILLHFFSRVPCSCGGVIKKLGWGQHLVFNLFFVAIAILGILLKQRKQNDITRPLSNGKQLSIA
jgi:putative oxidoreductase